jgi:hypothetical protein
MPDSIVDVIKSLPQILDDNIEPRALMTFIEDVYREQQLKNDSFLPGDQEFVTQFT